MRSAMLILSKRLNQKDAESSQIYCKLVKYIRIKSKDALNLLDVIFFDFSRLGV